MKIEPSTASEHGKKCRALVFYLTGDDPVKKLGKLITDSLAAIAAGDKVVSAYIKVRYAIGMGSREKFVHRGAGIRGNKTQAAGYFNSTFHNLRAKVAK